MEALPSNKILEFTPNQMRDVRKIFGYDDLNRLRQDIAILEDWIKKQQHFLVKEYDEAYLERHLICSKGSIERAKKHIDKICTLRGLMPDYLQGFDIKNEFNDLLAVTHTCILPKLTPDNYRLLYTSYHNPDATIYEPRHMARYLIVMVEYLHRYDYNAGIEMIIDSKLLTLAVVSKLNPIVIGNTLMIITEAIGLRVKGLHCISGSKFTETLLTIMRKALSKKLNSRIHIHDSYESMFKLISKDTIPQDLGGDLPTTLKEITDNNLKEFSTPEFVKRMKYMESAKTDESKRLRSQFNEDYSGMPGSFKVLSVD